MSDINIEVENGTSKRLLTAGKVCNDDIVVTATGGGGDNEAYKALVENSTTHFVAPKNTDIVKAYLFCTPGSINNNLIEADIRNVQRYVDQYAFSRCHALTKVICPADFSWSVPFQQYAFDYSVNLENFEYLGNGDLATGVFRNCYGIKKINMPQMQVTIKISNVFTECRSLEELYLNKIKENIQVGSGTSWGHLLKVECLVGLIQNLVITTTTKTLTIGTANVEKLEGLYCKIIDDTTDTLTMELCESTDEGAMTLEEYWTMKGWSVI